MPDLSRFRSQPGVGHTPAAADLRREVSLRYDGEIPAECLAAIAAAEQAEREAALTAHLSPKARLRFAAAKEWNLAKREFRTLCRMMREGSFKRSDECYGQLQRNARTRAYPHIEAWASVRHQERSA